MVPITIIIMIVVGFNNDNNGVMIIMSYNIARNNINNWLLLKV